MSDDEYAAAGAILLDDPAEIWARAELLRVATSPQTWDEPLRTLPRGTAARPAAVLILFGVLDALPSAHEAPRRCR